MKVVVAGVFVAFAFLCFCSSRDVPARIACSVIVPETAITQAGQQQQQQQQQQ